MLRPLNLDDVFILGPARCAPTILILNAALFGVKALTDESPLRLFP